MNAPAPEPTFISQTPTLRSESTPGVFTRDTFIKICGITKYEDAQFALDAGANALGFIFAESRRRVSVEAARDILRRLPQQGHYVGVFMNQSPDFIDEVVKQVPIRQLQLHGNENIADFAQLHKPIIKRIRVKPNDTARELAQRIDAIEHAIPLVDPGCGDGERFDWSLLASVRSPFLLAGGLAPENITAAITIAKPMGVDVCTGVEGLPGVKDHAKLAAFISTIRSHDARH